MNAFTTTGAMQTVAGTSLNIATDEQENIFIVQGAITMIPIHAASLNNSQETCSHIAKDSWVGRRLFYKRNIWKRS